MVDTGKYTESEATILHHFFTNTGDTYFLKNFPDPEVAALFVASYSRNKKTLLDMFLDTLIDLDIIEPHNKPIKKQIKDLKKQDSTSDIEAKIKELNLELYSESSTELRQIRPDLVAESFSKWAQKITNIENDKDSKELMETLGPKAQGLFAVWADKYGHDSLKDMAHGLGFACENVSNIFSVILEDHRLGDYQEKSTRYLEFSEGSVLLPKEFAGTIWESKINENTRIVMQTYRTVLEDIVNYLKANRKKPNEIKDSAWDAAIKAEAFDNARYILPTRIKTNIGQISNARTLAEQLSEMLVSSIAEVRERAQEIKTEAEKVFPTLLVNVYKNKHMAEAKETMRNIGLVLEDKLKSHRYNENSVKLIDCTNDLDNKIIASMLYEAVSPKYTWQDCYDLTSSMAIEEKVTIVETFFANRVHEHDRVDVLTGKTETRMYNHMPMHALDGGKLKFEIVMDYGAFRDVHRHRRASQRRQLLTTDLGFEIPRMVKEIGGEMEAKYIEAMTHSANLYNELRNSGEFPPEVLQYIPNFAFRISETIEMFYVLPLRTTPQGHFAYRKLFQQMFLEVRDVMPLISEHIKPDMNEYQLGRLKQEQRYFTKAEERGLDESQLIKPG
ncbi:MAG: FAD-dependent thymidylate synthase [DPANN group archaeon]|nr:FAD-dependent thymidylate synthase [DPANN group archaeon]